jgi:hypothetical protein
MKSPLILSTILFLSLFYSCSEKDDDEGLYAEYLVARPITITHDEFENGVELVAPVPVKESGKIYAYGDYIFVNDRYRGVHIIDNRDPTVPEKVGFIKIAGNVDISVKDNYLYADSLTDIIVLDISDIGNIHVVNRLFNVLGDNIVWPADADIFEYGEVDFEQEIILGWDVATERRLVSEVQQRETDVVFDAMLAEAGTGQGGSLARFRIVEDFLYAVDSHSINIFDISELARPQDLQDVFAGFDIETIFSQGNTLFLGSKSGMYVYDISDPSTPAFVSEFQHGTACDPVVVDGSHAYVTLRGGNSCGAVESGLFVIDLSVLTSPVLLASYPLDGPYGLGIKGSLLFVCDGTSGLRVFDKTDPTALREVSHLTELVSYDVIPLEDRLLMVGDGKLHQYSYLPDGIAWLSTLELH